MSRIAALSAELHALASTIAGHSSPTAIAQSVAAGFKSIATHLEEAADHAKALLSGADVDHQAITHAIATVGVAHLPAELFTALGVPAAAPAPAVDQVQPAPLPQRMYEAYAAELRAQRDYAPTPWSALDPAWQAAWAKAAEVAQAGAAS